ncbi:pyruvate ferredoxin oxidoreductase, partial [Candidatus Parcubacteria bacterium]|nr:pyruvate ferredoxin oxidoreductase [Candidatus Parcubacteria bacterium]
KYKTNDAEHIIIVLSSTAGTAKMVVDDLRKKGEKVGLIKIRTMRPFPNTEIAQALKNAKSAAILDRSVSYGNYSPVFTEVRSALYNLDNKPKLHNYIYGIGGRNIGLDDLKKVFNNLIKNNISDKINYIGLRK